MSAVFIVGISLYFLLMLLIGYFASRRIKTMEDYLIAGRRLPFFLAVPTLVATWFGAGSCMGVSGSVYAKGFYSVLPDPFGCSLALIVAGLFFAIPFRRLKLLTLSDLLHNAFGARFERVATMLTIPFYIGTLASQMLAMGYIFNIVSGGSVEWGIVLGSVIVLGYTVTGGMWAVTWTDFVQLGMLTVGMLLIVPICVDHAQNIGLVRETFFNELTTLLPNHANGHWSAYWGRICMTGLGAIMGQDIIQRLLASRTEKIACLSAVSAGFCYLGLGLIPLFVGLVGRDILPGLEKPEQLIPLLAQQYLSPVGFTVFACGLLAAIMSTADSYLLAGTALIANNLVFKLYPIQNERIKIKRLRWMNLALAGLALLLALSGPTIFDLMVHSGVTLFVCIFVPTCAALFWKSADRVAAWGAVLGGAITWLGFILVNYKVFTGQYEEMLFSAAFFGSLVSGVSFIAIHYAQPFVWKVAPLSSRS